MSQYRSRVKLPWIVTVLITVGALCQSFQEQLPEYFGVETLDEAEAFFEQYPDSYYLNDQLSQLYLEANDLRRSLYFRRQADELLAASVDQEYAIER